MEIFKIFHKARVNRASPCLHGRELEGFESSTDAVRRALLVGFANRLARRMPRHNGYRTLNGKATLAQLHPSTARIGADEDGLTPEFLIYHELIATARVFLSKVTAEPCPCFSHIAILVQM